MVDLKGGGAKGQDNYERNNNNAMISDVMGAAEDDYGDYGDEEGFKRENEAAFDFMWIDRLKSIPNSRFFLNIHILTISYNNK